MPTTPHIERHFTATDTVRDLVIGMSDGLTVPFALAAGLSGAVDSIGLIVTAGLAEVAAGASAMGLGGYLAARTDAEHFVGNGLAKNARPRSYLKPKPPRSPRFSGTTACPRRDGDRGGGRDPFESQVVGGFHDQV